MNTDIIGGFAIVNPNCNGCGNPLLLENAWMTDGCPCNSVLGVNSMNETRWRLLMTLQQKQARERDGLLVACRAMLDSTGGSQHWQGETHDALKQIESAVKASV